MHGNFNGTQGTQDRFGNPNSARDFNGTSDFIQVPPISSINNTSALSISVWVKPEGATGSRQFIVSRGYDFANGSFFLCHESNQNIDKIRFSINGYSNFNLLSPSSYPIPYSNWQHIVISKSQSSIEMYLNSVLVKSENHVGLLGALNDSVNFGLHLYNFFPYYFKGKMDDIGIWNRALTHNEVSSLYASNISNQAPICLPALTTTSPVAIGTDSAVLGGVISNVGGPTIFIRGICYSTTPNPILGNLKTENGSGNGTFRAVLRGLNPNTTYYARCYAKNINGVVTYGNEISFRTNQLFVGDFYGGGFVVSYDTLSRSGIICAPVDTGWHIWGCMGTNISGTSTAIGTGQTNTNLILAGCSSRPIAASVCANLILNGYDDWFLPSANELLLAYSLLRSRNIANLGPHNYTSSQINPDLVHDVNTSKGSPGHIGQAFKWQYSQVRPFRYFTLP